MGIEMEDQKVDTETAPTQESYTVLAFEGSHLPENYKALVYSKWMRSLRYGNSYFKLTSSDEYFAAYNRFIEGLLLSEGSKVRLAVLTNDPDVVLGFSVSRPDVLDYVHVQKDQRKQGIATSLTNFPFTFITHLTQDGLSIWGSKLKNVRFNPFQ
jgi:hypothetical protein